MLVNNYSNKAKWKNCSGFPWWSGGKESVLRLRGPWFNRWSRKIPRAAGSEACVPQLEPVLWNPRAMTTEHTFSHHWTPWTLESVLRSKRNNSTVKPLHRNKRVAPTLYNWRKPLYRNEDTVKPTSKEKRKNCSIRLYEAYYNATE